MANEQDSGINITSDPIGVVKKLTGEAVAVSSTGVTRELKVGDPVYPFEKIVNKSGVILVEFNDGSSMDMGPEDQTVLDEDVIPERHELAATGEEATTDVAAIQEALQAGADPTLVAEATAAGSPAAGQRAAVATDDSEGSEGGMEVIRDAHETIAGAGFDTSGPAGLAGAAIEREVGEVASGVTEDIAAATLGPATPFLVINPVGPTDDTTPDITGTATPNSTVTLLVGNQVLSTKAGPDGFWLVTPTDPLPVGQEITATGTVTDENGNTSPPSQAVISITDTTALPTLVINPVGPTDDTTPDITGTATPNSTVTLLVGSQVLTAQAGPDGFWKVTPTDPLPVGQVITATGTATDENGNTSPLAQAPISITDTSTFITIDGPVEGDNVVDVAEQTDVLVSGTSEPNTNVVVSFIDEANGQVVSKLVTTDEQGNWSLIGEEVDLTPLQSGNVIVQAVGTDPHNNTATATTNITLQPSISVTAITDDTGNPTDHITSDQTLEISGTTEPNSTVEVFIDNVSIGTVTSDPNGNWTIDHTGTSLPEGPHEITATVTDQSGNTGTSTEFPITIDVTPPAVAITGITDDTGNPTDFVTTDQTLVISGTSEPGSTVEVQIDGTPIGTVVVDPAGNWSIDHTATSIPEGSHNITATSTDPAGNQVTTTQPLTIDVTAPSIAITAITDDTGNPTDFLTNDQTLVISGTSDNPNSTVEVFIDGTSIGSVPTDASGNWSIDHTATALPEGPHNITATTTDPAGNQATTGQPVTIDVTAPALAITAITDDTGNPTDFITNDQTLVISGTSNNPNSTVEVFVDGTSIGSVPTDASGNWSIDHTATALPEGPHNITATTTDPAGNQTTTGQPVTIDVTAPAIAITGITDDTGVPADFVTSDQNLVISGTSDNPNSTVEVFIDGSSIGVVPTDASGNWSVDHTGTTLLEGTYNITATTTDAVGNTTSAVQPLTIDLTPPAIAITAITDDTGNPTDFITSDQNLVISGSTDNPANTVEVFIDGNSIGNAVVDSNGNWSIDHTATTLPEGPHNITAVSTDPSGQQQTTDQPLTIDVTAPAIAITGITDDSGNPADFITNDQTLVISGSSNNPNSTVAVSIGGILIGTVPTDASGNWSIDHTATALPEGTHNVTASTTDTAGNVANTAQPVTIDVTAPAIAITGITDDSGNPTDFITNDQTLVISGTSGNPNSTVTVSIDGNLIGTVPTDASGNWSIDHTATALPEGPHNITASTTDAAGNAANTAQSVTIDVTAPTVAITGITDDSGNPADFITNDQTLVISGTSNNPNSTVEVFIDGASIGTVPTDGSGNWNIDHTLTAIPEGPHTITATTVDTAGNTVTTDQALTIDVTAPAIAITGITDDTGNPTDFVTSDQTLVISGTSNNPNSTVEVFIDGVSIGTVPTDNSGAWSIDHTGTALPEGSYNISATTVDTAGNPASVNQALTIDLTPPAVTITGITDDSGNPTDFITNDQNLVISGSTDNPANTVEVFIDGVSIGNATVDTNGNWSIDHTATTLPEGSHNITAVSTDPSGQQVTANQPLVIDVTAPAIDITGITDDSGNPTDFITNDQTLVISGTSNNPNSTVEVFIDGTSIGTVPTDGSGNWNIDHTPTTLSEGAHTITATTVDTAGNTATTDQALTIDVTAPAIDITGITDDSGNPTDFITNDQTLVISGSSNNPNSTVEVFIDGVSIGTVPTDGSGNWNIDHTPTTLSEGAHTITATTVDTAGNTATTDQALTIDVTAPTVAITGITDDSGNPADFITNDQTLVISGTSNNPNSTVEVFIDGVSIGTVPTDGSGNWNIDHTPTTLPEGAHTITATTVDTAGNTATTDQSLTIDATAPAIDITGITDDSGNPTDFITNDQTLVISGSSNNPNSTVEVFIDGVSIGTVPTDGSGNWNIDHTPTTLSEGAHTITATTVDTAGNTATTDQSLTIDVTAPAIDITGITDDSGNPTDFITNDQTLVISGSSNNPNSTVEVFIDGVSIGTVPTDGSGNWNIDHTPTTLSEGAHTITATTVDTAGNTATTDQSLTIDVTAPAIDITGITDDSGNPTDFITNDQTLVISGSSNNPNSTVEVFIDGVSIGTVPTDGSGNWNIDHTPTTLSEGAHTITATTVDTAGNTATTDQALTIDVTEPAIDITGITDDSGNPTDFITNDQTLVISGSSNNPNSTVEVFIDGVSIGTVPTDGSGNWNIDHTPTTLSEGAHTITATTVDTAGNTATTDQSLTIDVTAPAIDITGITDDSGNPTDFITNDQTLVISGSSNNPNSTVEVFIDGVSIGTVPTDGSGNWNIDHTPTTLSEGAHTITATTVDTAGNTATTDQALTIDVTEPAIDITGITDDSGNPTDFITNDQTLVISGSSNNPNSTVEVFIDGVSIGTVPTDGSGNWNIDHTPTTLSEGAHTITATTVDTAGNTATTDQSLTIDVTAPAIDITGISDDTGNPTDFVTSDQTLVISGSSNNPNSTVEVFIDGTSIGTVSTDGSGAWSIDHTGTTLPEGSYNISATTVDAAGNVATTDQSLTIEVNDPPVITTNEITIDEGQTITLSSANLAATDPETADPALQFTVSNIQNGQFELVGSPGTPVTSFTQQQVMNNEIQFVHDDSEGEPSYTVTVSDPQGLTDTSDVKVDFTNINEAPIVGDVILSQVVEDNTLVITKDELLANSADPETGNASLTITSLTVDPTHGTIVDNGNDTWTFTPTLHHSAEDIPFTFTVSDGALSTNGTATLDIIAEADAPTIDIGLPSIGQGNGLTGEYYGHTATVGVFDLDDVAPVVNSRDPDATFIATSVNYNYQDQTLGTGQSLQQFLGSDGGSLSADPVDASHGLLNLKGFIYLEAGSYDLSVLHDDGVSIDIGGTTILSENTWSPTPNTGTFTINSSGVYEVNILYYDQGGPHNLNINLGPSGQTPLPPLSGSNTFQDLDAAKAAVTDGGLEFVDNPTGMDYYTVKGNTGDEDTYIELVDLGANLVDVDGSESLVLSIENIPIGAELFDGTNRFTATSANTTVDVSIGWNLSNLSIKPPLDFNGNFDLNFKATTIEQVNNDTAATSETITVTVLPVVDIEPTANDFALELNESTTAGGLTTHVFSEADFTDATKGNYFDEQGDALSSITITSLPTNGTLVFNGNPVTAGQTINVSDINQLSFQADGNESGDNYASFGYQVSDGTNSSTTHTISINIAAQADQPTINLALAQTSTVFNSGFEGATVSSGQASFVNTVDGWQTNSSIEVRGWAGDAYSSNSGSHFIELNDDPTNQFPDALDIFRDISTEAGAKYDLSFYYSPRPGFDAETTKIEVWWGGKLVKTIADDGTGLTDSNWQRIDVELAGDGTTNRLEFRAAGVPKAGGRGGFLDDVQIVETKGGAAAGFEDTTIKLPDITVAAGDPSEQLTYSLSGMPVSTVISDGVNSEVFSGGQLDISGWTLNNLSLTPPPGHNTDIDLTFTAVATEPSTGHSTQASQSIHVDIITLPDQTSSTSSYVDGDTGDNVLTGGADIDFISGGFGHDIMTGGDGADVFVWHAADAQAGSVQEDHITDFEVHKDVINVKDLLVGENPQNIDNFLSLNFSQDPVTSEISTTIDVSPNGDGQVLQKIVLDKVDLSAEYGTANSSQIIDSMLGEGKLVIDQ